MCRPSNTTMRNNVFCAVRPEKLQPGCISRELRREIQSGVSLLEKVVVEGWLAENCCDWVTGTFWQPKGKGTSTVRSRYQRTGEDIAG
jgi:hypothetical protein